MVFGCSGRRRVSSFVIFMIALRPEKQALTPDPLSHAVGEGRRAACVDSKQAVSRRRATKCPGCCGFSRPSKVRAYQQKYLFLQFLRCCRDVLSTHPITLGQIGQRSALAETVRDAYPLE